MTNGKSEVRIKTVLLLGEVRNQLLYLIVMVSPLKYAHIALLKIIISSTLVKKKSSLPLVVCCDVHQQEEVKFSSSESNMSRQSLTYELFYLHLCIQDKVVVFFG